MGFGLKWFWFLVNQIDWIEVVGCFNYIEMFVFVIFEKIYVVVCEDYKLKVGKIFVWMLVMFKELVVDFEIGFDFEFDRVVLCVFKVKIV